MTTVSSVRQRARALIREHAGDGAKLGGLALRLSAEGEEQLAFEVFRGCKQAVLGLTRAQIEGLLPVLHDWQSTDCFACFVSGVAWREGTLSDAAILKWTVSNNLWVRRAALASTIPLNLKARGATAPKGEAARTLAVCERLIDDREDMVVKALSWALRELARKDKAAVQSFLNRHKARLAARVIRETTNKLTTGLKNPRKKAKPRTRSH